MMILILANGQLDRQTLRSVCYTVDCIPYCLF